MPNPPTITPAMLCRVSDALEVISELGSARISLDLVCDECRNVPELHEYVANLMNEIHQLREQIKDVYERME